MRIRAVSAIYFDYLAQITVDSFFDYLYHPTQLARFYNNGKVEAGEMEFRKTERPFCWLSAVLSSSGVPFGSRP
jgi:hypothetical protein